MQRLLSSLLAVFVLVTSVSAHNWDPSSKEDVCHEEKLLGFFQFLWDLTEGSGTPQHCHYSQATLRKIREEEQRRMREEEQRRRRAERAIRVGTILLAVGGAVYLVKSRRDKGKDEKEDNKRFTLSVYNSPSSSSYAVQGIKINLSIPF